MWAGGKNRMIPKYKVQPGIPLYGYDTYVEPFFGGGAVAIYVYENNPTIKRFVINDISTELMGIYHAIKNDVNNFLEFMYVMENKYMPLDKPDRKKFYYKLRSEYMKDYQKWSKTEESAALYFLMKTGFNGIWQTMKESDGRFATPSGLLNQKSVVFDSNNVLEWYKFLQKVDIYSEDWLECASGVGGKSFFFCDPPYRNSFTSYGQTFTDDDQKRCIEFCKEQDKKGNLVMYCNRDFDDDFYTKNKGDLDISYYDVTYTAGRRKQEKMANGDTNYTAKPAREILLYN